MTPRWSMSLVCRTTSFVDVSSEANNSLQGTSLVYDDASRQTGPAVMDARLKYDTTRPIPIILVPQPSDDPNDPLVRSPSACTSLRGTAAYGG